MGGGGGWHASRCGGRLVGVEYFLLIFFCLVIFVEMVAGALYEFVRSRASRRMSQRSTCHDIWHV